MSRILVVLLFVLTARVSLAQPAPTESDKNAARVEFSKGTKSYNLGDFAEALQSFRAAYRAYEDSSFLFNIAQCQRQLGQTADALRTYKTYLRESPQAPNRVQVQRLVSELEQTIQREQASRSHPPQGTLSPDPDAVPERAGTTTAVTPDSTAPNAVPTEGAPPVSSNQSAVTATAPGPTSERTPIYKKWWLWTAVGVVVVGVALGVGLGVGLSKQSLSYPAVNGLSDGVVRF